MWEEYMYSGVWQSPGLFGEVQGWPDRIDESE